MPKRPDFKAIETESGWMISVPPSMSSTGKRERRFFEEPSHAEVFAKKLRGKYARGERGVVIDTAGASDAAEALAILAGTGITLTDAAKAALAAHQAGGKSEPFRVRYERAVLEGEARWRPSYLRDMGKLPDWVSEGFMDRQCSTITKDAVLLELKECGTKAQSTLQQRARYISAILGHKERHRKSKEIVILTDEQVEKMIAAAVTPQEQFTVGLLLFAGIRPSVEDGEITRLDWSAVGKKEIYIAPDVSKTGSDRHIPITPRLARMIEGHPKEGTVLPANWRRVYKRLRAAAGTKASDVTRHTFASHYLAAYGEEKTKAAMGHTQDSRTLFRHYRVAVTEAAGKTYFR